MAHGNRLQAAPAFSFACPSRDSKGTGREIDRGGDTQDNMVLLTEFIMYFGQRIETLQLTFRAFALCQRNSGLCGLSTEEKSHAFGVL